jgi:hypothetical protein
VAKENASVNAERRHEADLLRWARQRGDRGVIVAGRDEDAVKRLVTAAKITFEKDENAVGFVGRIFIRKDTP